MANKTKSEDLANPTTYNIYDEGHKTGSQVSIFIGPIWLEEIVSLQLNTESSDQEIWSYSNPYFDRVMIGRYRVRGAIGIAYSRPDYLLEVIGRARDISIQDGELYDIIENRKSIFESTLRYKMLSDTSIINSDKTETAISSYVNRISREIELMSYSGKRLDPEKFEITIITGNIYDNKQTIDIYEDAKIVGTGKIYVADDNAITEIYNFVARRKPERKEIIEVHRSDKYLSRRNLITMAREVTEQLVDSLLEPPIIKVTSPEVRTSSMFNTDKIAIAGLLNRSARMYGKSASFCEIVWSFEYPPYIKSFPDTGEKEKEIKSTTNLLMLTNPMGFKNPTSKKTEIKLVPPAISLKSGERKGFNNSFGNIISIERERTTTFISAVAPVVPESIMDTIGGTIAMPRKRRNDFNIGAYIPPQIISPSDVSYTDNDLEKYTNTTLWCSLLGFRSTARKISSDNEEDMHEKEDTGKFITELAQPLNTFAYINSVKGEVINNMLFFLKIAFPVYIDVMHTNVINTECRSTEKEIESGKTNKEICICVKGDVDRIRILENGEDMANGETKVIMDKLAKETLYATTAEINPLIEPDPSGDRPPNFFEIGTTMDSYILSTDFSKCVYVSPFIFRDWPDITEIICEGQGNPHKVNVAAMDTTPSDSSEYLCHMLHSNNQTDISCDVSLEYDWTLKSIEGYTQNGQEFSIHGVYFFNIENSDKYYITCPTCGDRIWYGDLILNVGLDPFPFNVKTIWLLSILPLWREESDSKDDMQYVHDLESTAGRYAEIYNITRCDSKMMDLDILAEKSGGLWDSFITKLRELLHIDVKTQVYLYPVKASMQRIASFIRGYSFRIDIEQIINQLLLCKFSNCITSASSSVIKMPIGGWTLKTALDVAIRNSKNDQGNPEVLSETTSVLKELATMVKSVVKEKTKINGIRMEESGDGKSIVAEMDIITPSPNIVSWGLTEEGYEELKGITAAEEEPGGGTEIILGGYDA